MDIDVPRALCLMMEGSTLLKAGRMGRPHFRRFKLSKDLQSLLWESPRKETHESSVAINHIVELAKGQTTKVFQTNPIPEYEAISFSILYKQGNAMRSLDIVCKDRTEYDVWTVGLEALIKGFDDVDSLQNMSPGSTSDIADKLSLEFGLAGEHVSVKEDACDVYTWGSSPKGTLGHGEETEELVPRVVEALLGRDIRKVSCGVEHTLAISVSGQLFAWGAGRGGKLGFGNMQDRYTPLRIGKLTDKHVCQISCNELHSAAVTADGQLFTWGRSGPRLGYLTSGRKQFTPRFVETLEKHKVTNVSCGMDFTIALTSDGKVFAFGENGSGQLGLGHFQSRSEPTLVEKLNEERISVISAGSMHAGAVTVNGDVWLWGANDFGQLGTGDTVGCDSPREAPSTFWNEEIQDIKCGGRHTIVLSCSGSIYCFGDGSNGQLGVRLLPNATMMRNPCKVVLPNITKFVKIGCGVAHSAAITEDGFLYTWGKGTRGRLGHGDHKDRFIPTPVGTMAYKNVQSIDCGAHHTAACAIRSWVQDDESRNCMACKAKFTTFQRRHHCRKCGGIFCANCTTNRFPILEIGYSDPVRVCDRCFTILSEDTS